MYSNLISFIIFIFLLYARSLHSKDRKKHVQYIRLAIFLDITLVLFLVFQQKALTKIDTQMHWMLWIHIPFAIFTLLSYGFAFYFGHMLLKGKEEYRRAMRILDKFILFIRSMNLLTSLLLWILK